MNVANVVNDVPVVNYVSVVHCANVGKVALRMVCMVLML